MVFISTLNIRTNRLKLKLGRSFKQPKQQLRQLRAISEESIGRYCDGVTTRFALGTNLTWL